MRRFDIIVCVFLFLALKTTAQIIHIPADYPTIQEGVNAASEGDTVLVSPGTYDENIVLTGINITLASHYLITGDTAFISSTIIDGNQSGSVITINENEDTTTRISGFSLTNGLGQNEDAGGGLTVNWSHPQLDHLKVYGNTAAYGGGMNVRYYEPSINDCVFQDNTATYGGGVYFMNSEPVLNDVTITGNISYRDGGGLYLDDCYPVMNKVTISNNSAGTSGGGMMIANYYPKLETEQVIISGNEAQQGGGICNSNELELHKCTITGNSSFGYGGGIYSSDFLQLVNTTVSGNTAHSGGGIYTTSYSTAEIDSTDLTENTAFEFGGGIFCGHDSYIQLHKASINENNAEYYGGGIYCEEYSELDLHGSTISSNHALYYGGGIYWDYYITPPHFDTTDRCNIYLNGAGAGNDLFTWYDTINVVVDTFTVFQPTDYHSADKHKFTFDILHGKTEQPDADLYVSPDGDNENDGLTPQAPLKTIDRALQKLRSDINHKHTIHLANGIYSPSSNGEKFPVQMVNYSSLAGESRSLTILDAEQTNQVLNLEDDTIPGIMNLTITGGKSHYGAGIRNYRSETTFNNMIVSGNQAIGLGTGFEGEGGGIQFNRCGNNKLYNMIIENNTGDFGGGVFARSSNLEMYNTEITSNQALTGGGIYLYDFDTVMMDKMRFSSNVATQLGGGIYAYICPVLTILNSIIDSNNSKRGGGLWTEFAPPVIINSLITNNAASQFCGGVGFYNDYFNNPGHECGFYNVTFAGNTYPALYSFSAGMDLVNSIFWDNTGAYQIQYTEPGVGDTLSMMNNDIQGGLDGVFIAGSQINWQPGNINADPQFLLTGDYPYSLTEGSPCIDAGTPDTAGLYLPYNDIIGNTRVWDGDGDGVPVIDMGPYEFGAPVNLPDDDHLNEVMSGNIVIYPNPASDHLTIYCPSKENIHQVSIINNIGQMVHSESLPVNQKKLFIRLDNFTQGLYTLIFSDEAGVCEVKKMVVIK